MTNAEMILKVRSTTSAVLFTKICIILVRLNIHSLEIIYFFQTYRLWWPQCHQLRTMWAIISSCFPNLTSFNSRRFLKWKCVQFICHVILINYGCFLLLTLVLNPCINYRAWRRMSSRCMSTCSGAQPSSNSSISNCNSSSSRISLLLLLWDSCRDCW